MKAYVMTTGALFGLLVLVHLWRMLEEGTGVARHPFFVVFTVVAAALCLWSWRLLRRPVRR